MKKKYFFLFFGIIFFLLAIFTTSVSSDKIGFYFIRELLSPSYNYFLWGDVFYCFLTFFFPIIGILYCTEEHFNKEIEKKQIINFFPIKILIISIIFSLIGYAISVFYFNVNVVEFLSSSIINKAWGFHNESIGEFMSIVYRVLFFTFISVIIIVINKGINKRKEAITIKNNIINFLNKPLIYGGFPFLMFLFFIFSINLHYNCINFIYDIDKDACLMHKKYRNFTINLERKFPENLMNTGKIRVLKNICGDKYSIGDKLFYSKECEFAYMVNYAINDRRYYDYDLYLYLYEDEYKLLSKYDEILNEFKDEDKNIEAKDKYQGSSSSWKKGTNFSLKNIEGAKIACLVDECFWLNKKEKYIASLKGQNLFESGAGEDVDNFLSYVLKNYPSAND